MKVSCLIKKPARTIALALATAALDVALGSTVTQTVAGNAGPWTYVNGGLNTADQYGVGDETAPVIINAASGLNFAADSQLTIQYVSGLVSAGPGFPAVDGNGDTAAPTNNGPGSSGRLDPSAFMNPATYPTYLTELVGTFANSSGAIVGTPFAIGDGALKVAVPIGASALQLGVNDDIYYDNSGSFVVDVSGAGSASPAPEPASLAYMAAGCILVGFGSLGNRRASQQP